MGIKAWMAACAAAMVCASAGEAGANIITLTFQGTIGENATHPAIDNEGLFGAAGASLVGDTFTAVIKYNDAVGYVYNSPGSNSVSGGGLDSMPNTITQGILTINGRSINRVYNWISDAGVTNLVDTADGYHVLGIYSLNRDSGPAQDSMYLYYYDSHTADGDIFDNTGSFSIDGGTITGVLISSSATASPLLPAGPVPPPPPPPVPEPATWAMLLLGVGALGTAMRTRRRPLAQA